MQGWGEPTDADGPSQQRHANVSAVGWGAKPRRPAVGAGNPVKSNVEKTAGGAEAGGAFSADR